VFQKVIADLEQLAKVIKKSDSTDGLESILRDCLRDIDQLKEKISSDEAPILERLKGELEVWQDKKDVILKETSGRQGMAKHAHFWVEQLKQIG